MKSPREGSKLGQRKILCDKYLLSGRLGDLVFTNYLLPVFLSIAAHINMLNNGGRGSGGQHQLRSFSFVSLLITSLLFMFFVASTAFTPQFTDISSNYDIVKEGDDLVLYCSLTEYCNTSSSCVASNIVFKHNGQLYNATQPSFIVFNRTMAQFTRINVTMDMHGSYQCLVTGYSVNRIYPGMHMINIARLPIQPVLSSCEIKNWQHLECKWLPTALRQKDHTTFDRSLQQELQMRLNRSGSGDDWERKCVAEAPRIDDQGEKIVLDQEQCSFWVQGDVQAPMADTDQICLRVAAYFKPSESVSASESLKVPVYSNERCYDPKSIVHSDPPSDLGSADITSTSVLLSWRKPWPQYSKSAALTYFISYLSESDGINLRNGTVVDVDNSTSYHLEGLHPFTNYSWFVTVKPKSGVYMSDESQRKTFWTAESVPCSGVPASNAAFSVTTLVGSTRRAISISWQPISKEDFCGPNFIYFVRRRPLTEHKDAPFRGSSTHDSYIDIDIDGLETEFIVGAQNDVGENAVHDRIIVPSSDHYSMLSDYRMVAEGNGSRVVLHWTRPTSSAGSDAFVIEDATVYWCKRDEIQRQACSEGFNRRSADINQLTFDLSLTEDFRKFKFGLAFTIMVESRLQSNGIVWNDCYHSLTDIADEPKWITASAQEDYNELVITWTLTKCDKKFQGYVQYIAIHYCLANSNESCTDGGAPVERLVPAYPQFYRLGGLDVGASYLIWSYSIATAGRSNLTSNVVFVSTSAPWYFKVGLATIFVCGFVFIIVAAFAFYTIYRHCYKCRNKFSNGLRISMPTVLKSATSSDIIGSFNDFSHTNRYKSVNCGGGFDRQISRLSNHSSAQTESISLDISQSSPLLTQKSTASTASPLGSTLLTQIPECTAPGADDDVFTTDIDSPPMEDRKYVKSYRTLPNTRSVAGAPAGVSYVNVSSPGLSVREVSPGQGYSRIMDMRVASRDCTPYINPMLVSFPDGGGNGENKGTMSSSTPDNWGITNSTGLDPTKAQLRKDGYLGIGPNMFGPEETFTVSSEDRLPVLVAPGTRLSGTGYADVQFVGGSVRQVSADGKVVGRPGYSYHDDVAGDLTRSNKSLADSSYADIRNGGTAVDNEWEDFTSPKILSVDRGETPSAPFFLPPPADFPRVSPKSGRKFSPPSKDGKSSSPTSSNRLLQVIPTPASQGRTSPSSVNRGPSPIPFQAALRPPESDLLRVPPASERSISPSNERHVIHPDQGVFRSVSPSPVRSSPVDYTNINSIPSSGNGEDLAVKMPVDCARHLVAPGARFNDNSGYVRHNELFGVEAQAPIFI